MEKINRVLVVGLGHRTGLAVCNYLAGLGKAVTASDIKPADSLAETVGRLDPAVRVVAGRQEPDLLDAGFELLVLSPGVPKSIPLVREAERRSIPVIAEIELAYLVMPGVFVGITGTDGKTTTTTLTGHLLAAQGVETLVGGNIGTPLISLAGKTTGRTAVVVELSSFQLETVREFRPRVATILNVTPDHLDRYRDMEEYGAAKFRIAMNQDGGDYFIANGDDARVMGGAARVRSAVHTFSLADRNADIHYDGKSIVLRRNGGEVTIAGTAGLQIPGLHNVQNAMAAVLMTVSACEILGVAPDFSRIADALCSFRGLAHRMEPVGSFMGRSFINDSKATTVGAVEMAVRGFDGDCVLILGGRTKGDDYSRLADGLRGRVRGIVLIGESRSDFSKIFSEFNLIEADTMEDAVAKGMGMSSRGDTILLSPACASFDMFENYEERGDRFRETVRRLESGDLRWT
ncbi:MAG: UDP-N-acetylmuramoyl-L-alanine--D-glutamate ligase [Spirochaetes bacterium]|nr:UDP-N-acetylmuramoyl-L-alanine--D-glutamate ligase [Spirochaetota bacterium]